MEHLERKLAVASELAAEGLVRSAGRTAAQGPKERQEFAPAFVLAIEEAFAGEDLSVEADARIAEISFWNRARSEVDLVARRRETSEIVLVGELKCWDVSHQIFDLLKVSCLLAAGAEAGFLATIVRRSSDFDSQPGGELFSARPGERRRHSVSNLLREYPKVSRASYGHGLPEPLTVPDVIETISAGEPLPVPAYEGHELRVSLVEVRGSDRIPLAELLAAP